MKRASLLKTGLLALLLGLAGCGSLSGSGGWVTLIDGDKGLENWNRVGDANWRAEGGAIVADAGKGGFLVTRDSYRDFVIRVEFWAADNANSGVFVRCADPKAITDRSCYEANIFDQRPDPKYATGAIVHHTAVTTVQKAGGKWNTYEITMVGTQLTVVLNGIETARLQHSQFAQGPIALQYGTLPPNAAPSGAIKWRKVQIKRL